jgi:hypothetical protein
MIVGSVLELSVVVSHLMEAGGIPLQRDRQKTSSRACAVDPLSLYQVVGPVV